jgi:hypothetical protein
VNVPEGEKMKHSECPVSVNVPVKVLPSGDRVAEKFTTRSSKLITTGAKDPEN